MPSSTWTADALRSEARALSATAWRLVEAQHRVSTMNLVDRLDEQQLLEEILEETKPIIPPDCAHLDYLFHTPFRYGAYPHGSRFRRAGRSPGVWYGSEAVETAVAEMVFYRFLFFAESPSTPWPDAAAEYTGVSARIGGLAVDLTVPPLVDGKDDWTHPTRYEPCQDLAESARVAGCEIIRYASVRDPGGGGNLAVLTCAVFARPKPTNRATWRIRLGRFGAMATCDGRSVGLQFSPGDFQDPRLEGMIWERP